MSFAFMVGCETLTLVVPIDDAALAVEAQSSDTIDNVEKKVRDEGQMADEYVVSTGVTHSRITMSGRNPPGPSLRIFTGRPLPRSRSTATLLKAMPPGGGDLESVASL